MKNEKERYKNKKSNQGGMWSPRTVGQLFYHSEHIAKIGIAISPLAHPHISTHSHAARKVVSPALAHLFPDYYQQKSASAVNMESEPSVSRIFSI